MEKTTKYLPVHNKTKTQTSHKMNWKCVIN